MVGVGHNAPVEDVQERLWARLQQLTKADKLLIAVSGGPDSVALLRLLVHSPYKLEVAHFDHALRDASSQDADFVRDLAARLDLPFHTERAEVARIAAAKGWNVEDAARRLRYGFLTRTAKRVAADAIVTGHTANDQAETVLLQLLRGAAYLRGMKAVQGRVVRPLLATERRELLEVLRSTDQAFLSDETNLDTSKTRAWLRHDMLPLLARRYPSLKTTLGRLAQVQGAALEHLQQQGRALIADKRIETGALQKASLAVQRQAVAELLKDAEVPVSFERVEDLLSLLDTEKPVRMSLSKTLNARNAYGKLTLIEKSEHGLPETPVTRAADLPPEVGVAALAYPNLTYRSRRPGDVIRLSGGTKKLSDLLIDKKIPAEERDAVRLLVSGQQVLWAEDVAVDVSVARASSDADTPFMKRALALADQAAALGELPVGAVVVCNGEVVAEAHNETEARRDPTAHAEVLALRRAAERLGDWRLSDCTLFVTLEPCPMCFGAALQAHLPRIVYGAENRLEGALGSVMDLRGAAWKRTLEIRGGVLAGRSAALLKMFFSAKR